MLGPCVCLSLPVCLPRTVCPCMSSFSTRSTSILSAHKTIHHHLQTFSVYSLNNRYSENNASPISYVSNLLYRRLSVNIPFKSKCEMDAKRRFTCCRNVYPFPECHNLQSAVLLDSTFLHFFFQGETTLEWLTSPGYKKKKEKKHD